MNAWVCVRAWKTCYDKRPTLLEFRVRWPVPYLSGRAHIRRWWRWRQWLECGAASHAARPRRGGGRGGVLRGAADRALGRRRLHASLVGPVLRRALAAAAACARLRHRGVASAVGPHRHPHRQRPLPGHARPAGVGPIRTCLPDHPTLNPHPHPHPNPNQAGGREMSARLTTALANLTL